MGKNRILKYIFAYNTEIKRTMATLAYLIGNSKYIYLTHSKILKMMLKN